MNAKLKVTVPNDDPMPPEVIAQSIYEISNAMKVLSQSALNRNAIVALIHDKTKIMKSTIHEVLNHLNDLEEHWLK